MAFFIWILLLSAKGVDIICNFNKCSEMKKGDGACDTNCMSPYCNFDAYVFLNDERDFSSDCERECLSHCNQRILGNGICDDSCNDSSCAYDLGDCSYCGSSCKKSQLGGTCDEECNVPECYWDMGACRECSSGCNLSIWGNGVCDEVCNNVDCNFDMGDCINSTCAFGCNTWMVGNSICDEACYVEECEYDKTDCTCAPFCWDDLLKNGVCDEACNNLGCKFDNGDCGYCSSGCTMRMLANNICDPKCDTKECEWDYYACGCAEGCSVIDYGKCKPECLVGTCNYDRMSSDNNKWCNDKELVLFTFYQQMLMNDTSYVVDVEKCFSVSNYKCNLTMALGQDKCYSECFYPECNYGLCNMSSYSDCTQSLPASAWNLCKLCTSTSESLGSCSQCFDTTISCTYLNLFGTSVYYSNYLPISEVFPHFSFYYMTSIQNSNSPSGDGTINFPYDTLFYALNSINTYYNAIFLKNDGVYNWLDYYFGIETTQLQWWKIAPLDGSMITVKVDCWSDREWWISGQLEIENIIFDGQSAYFLACSDSIYCYYCSYNTYNATDGYYYSDRGERASKRLPNSSCDFNDKWEMNLFRLNSVRYPSYLFLRNVTFRNFRNKWTSIVFGEGSLRIFNVSFDNISLSAKNHSAVLSISATGNQVQGSELIYIGGSVTRLNNGYEFEDPIEFRGFFYSSNITKILIKNVEFSYNLVNRKTGSQLKQASLIYADSINFIEINNCTFMYNYFETGIIRLILNVLGYPGGVNETYYLPYLYKDHISVLNSTFISNYADTSLIDVEFSYYLLNIHLKNLTFEANGIGNGPAVLISNAFMLDEYKNGVVKPYKLFSGMNVHAVINERWCKIDNISFINNHGTALLFLTNMAHLSLKNLIIESNGSPNEDKNLNSLLLNYYIENPDVYIKRQKKTTEVLDCEYLVSISNSYNVDISPADIKNNTCRNSSPTYKIVESNTIDINSINCLENTGNGVLPICFLFSGNFSRVLENSLFEGNFNKYPTGTGAIEIKDGNGLYMNNCVFRENTGGYGGAIYQAGQTVVIEESLFDQNMSPGGSGGALFIIQTSTSETGLLAISSSNFTNNSADYGGSIYIAQQWAGSSRTEITVKNSIFNLSSASYGSVLYVDSTVSLVNSSKISLSNFIENSASVSGAIALYYGNGALDIENCNFFGNSGQFGSVLQIDIIYSLVTINSSKFASNKGLGVIFGNNQNSFSYVETANCTFEYNYGSAISLNYDSLQDSGSVFRHNSGNFGSCLRLQNNAIGLSNNSFYFNNTSSTNGGAILLSSDSQFYCYFCNFTKNHAMEGGSIYVEQDSQITILDSIFFQNSCEDDGSAIYIFNSNKNSTINSAKIYENQSGNDGLIVLINSQLLINSSEIYKNKGGIKLTISSVEIYDSKFFNHSCFQGCFINLSAGSTSYINNSTFANGISSDSGGAIYSSSSDLIIELSEFKQISSAKAGGSIYSWFDNSLTIKKCKFLENYSLDSGAIIYALLTPIVIEHSIFDGFSRTGIYGSSLNRLDISNSAFINGKGIFGGGIYCDSCIDVKINFCLFQNNSASVAGGGLYFDTDIEISQANKYEIYMGSFEDNSAPIGGAVYVNGISMSIFTTNFIENKALTNEIFTNSPISEGIGGAIKMSCIGISLCDFDVGSCNFTGNLASYKGGAIHWDDWKPVLSENYFINNSAEYGKDYSSYPVKLMSVSEAGNLEGYTRQLSEIPISVFNLSSLAPGQDTKQPIKVALVDSMNQIITTDNINLGELKSENISTIIAGVTKVKAVKGIFTFSQYIISDEPGSNVTIGVFSSAIDKYKKSQTNDTVFDQTLLIKVLLRGCEIGEIKAGKTCEVCGIGYYSLDPSKTICLACSNNAECFGNYTMVPKPGYWRDNAYTDKFWKCPNSDACLGSPDPKNLSYTGECSKGYTGNMCQSCKAGYSRSSNNKCKECPSLVENLAITIVIIIALAILAFIMVRTTIKSALKPKKLTSIYIKILLNYLQMVILTSTFKLNWPNEVLELFYIQSSTDYVYQQLYSFQCLLASDTSRNLIYYRSLVLISLLPFFMALIAMIIWTMIKIKKKSFKDFWDDSISTCIILLFLVHPSIVKKMFASFNCTEINSGEYWLEEDLDIRCWDSDHIFYILVVSLPSIIIWGILLPTVCLLALVKSRNRLKELNVRLRFGFLFNGYQLSRYYWEFIIIYSKIILICCSVFLTNVALKVQALIAAILLSVFLQLQYSNSPYIEPRLNRMELQAKLVCVITIYSGLFFLTGSLGYTVSFLFFMLMIISNCYFLVYWCVNVFKEVLCFVYKYAKQLNSKNKLPNDPDNENLKKEIDAISSQGFDQKHEVSLNSEGIQENQLNFESIKSEMEFAKDSQKSKS